MMEIFHKLVFGFSVALTFAEFVILLHRLSVGHPDRRPSRHRTDSNGCDADADHLRPPARRGDDHAGWHLLRGRVWWLNHRHSGQSAGRDCLRSITCIDGHQMARQGRAGPALAIAAIASFFAGTVCTLIIALFGPLIADVALKFGSTEYFSLMMMGLVFAAMLAQGDMVKSLAMVVLGLLMGCVGTDVDSGFRRFSFNIIELSDGIGFVVIAIGVFAMSEIMVNLSDPEERMILTSNVRNLLPSKDDIKRSIGPIIRGTGLGAFFGVLPGTGPAIASFSSYMVEKKAGQGPFAFRQRRDRRSGGTRGRQQRGRAVQVHSDAHAGDSCKRDDGAAARRTHDPRHRARPDGDD